MSELTNDIDELIGKYLANEASPDETQLLGVWMEKSDENRKYFNDLKLLFDRAAEVKDLPTFDTDLAWEKLKAQVIHETASPKTPDRQRSMWGAGLRIAASVLLVATMGYIIYQSLEPTTESIQFAAINIPVQDTLPDGSTAFLNKETSLSYTYDSKKKTRTAKLEGEGYFEVVHKEDQPFVIDANQVIIEDIGTAFNVKAYPDSPLVEVYVESGVVAFYTQSNPGLKLTAGQTGVYDRAKDLFSWSDKSDTNIVAYKTRIFGFHDNDLGTVIERLNEVYDVKLRLANPALASCRLTVSFEGESVDVIADIIAETLSLTYEVNENEIVLDGEPCAN